MMIGGPKAGQWWSGEGSIMRCMGVFLARPPSFDAVSEVMQEVRQHTYVWTPLPFNDGQTYAWVHESLLRDKLPASAIIRELVNGYHPYWVEDPR